jgi:hypothetical protein
MPCADDATGGSGGSATRRWKSANKLWGMAALAIRNATGRPWLATFAPILINSSFNLVSNRSSVGSGVAGVRRKLPRLWACA